MPWTVRWARIGALLLLAAICVDLANVHCDGPMVSDGRQTAVVIASQSDSGDPCATTCVPDCFCCSRTEQASTIELHRQADPLTACAVDRVPRPAAGILVLPYHPPLNLL